MVSGITSSSIPDLRRLSAPTKSDGKGAEAARDLPARGHGSAALASYDTIDFLLIPAFHSKL